MVHEIVEDGILLNIDMYVNLTVPCHTSDDVTYAVKILTAFATEMTRQGQLHELENRQAISELTGSLPYLPELIRWPERMRLICVSYSGCNLPMLAASSGLPPQLADSCTTYR